MLRIASGLPPDKVVSQLSIHLGLESSLPDSCILPTTMNYSCRVASGQSSGQIDKQLELITEQLEMVIQKYLRNEYRTIGEYNAEAEVPEPYRFVAIANFPANFTETAARRLASIATSELVVVFFPFFQWIQHKHCCLVLRLVILNQIQTNPHITKWHVYLG